MILSDKQKYARVIEEYAINQAESAFSCAYFDMVEELTKLHIQLNSVMVVEESNEEIKEKYIDNLDIIKKLRPGSGGSYYDLIRNKNTMLKVRKNIEVFGKYDFYNIYLSRCPDDFADKDSRENLFRSGRELTRRVRGW
jgi:hypothetical protein